ncbi:MAG: Helicase PriA essential for oriC/DnaA-independent replication [Alphaproteobacteria bacterium]|nr:Helicase PriA essential for oriC/DnaA-independent replication [Alphaproteobacteria bacterium]
MVMSQSSLFNAGETLEPGSRAQVLVPYPLSRAYDYLVPQNMPVAAGDYVRVPLGKRDTIGVVWTTDAADAKVDPAKLKSVLQKFTFDPMPQVHRQFIEWVARYTMSDVGSVLKMSLSAPEALQPPKSVPVFTLTENIPVKLPASRQKIIDLLKDGIPRRAVDIARAAGCSAAVVRSMAAVGQLQTLAGAPPAPCEMLDIAENRLSFSPDQKNAADALQKLAAANQYAAVLLDGVTGSGKTEVYFEAIAEALRNGKQALILLPEISLSAQFLERFERRFGVQPALWHSEVPTAQRRVTWTGVAEGKTRVVVGARSALFLPFADLGLIVVDEEHDASYKQEEGVLYNARDMAIVRARLGSFPIVLVSATPSLETMVNVQQGKYTYLNLPSRHAGARMPDINVINLKVTPPERQKFIAPPLQKALHEVFEAKEQSLLFLNRRGYAPLTLCRTCGHRFQCPSCAAWLVEHKRHSRLQCHHCGFAQAVPRNCPSCQAEDSFAACGPGVERIQEEVQLLIPEARTFILASDVITSPGMISAAVHDIEDHKYDIIIGTQIIAKGHHFPSLTLVGVIDADLGLAGGDLRAGERTFQLLHQVSGRAGRAEKPGRVFIQTYMPEQTVIKALAKNDRDEFLAVEAREREKALMPPFGRLAALILSDPDENKLDVFCRTLAQKAPRYDDIRVLGPAPAPMGFLRGKHRRRFLVKAGKNLPIQKYLAEWLGNVKAPSSLQLKVDIDPQSFF